MLGDDIGLNHFLKAHPEMSVLPSRNSILILHGTFAFCARFEEGAIVEDAFEIQIEIPDSFPKSVPIVSEIGTRIPRSSDFHVNGNGTLCLGSPLRLLLKIAGSPTLCGFAQNCLIPYLYAMSVKLNQGGKFSFGELDHGEPGSLADYKELFGLKNASQAKQALKLLSLKPRMANKQSCPCGCGKRLSQCKFHKVINKFRTLTSRSWFRAHAEGRDIAKNEVIDETANN